MARTRKMKRGPRRQKTDVVWCTICKKQRYRFATFFHNGERACKKHFSEADRKRIQSS